MMEGLGWSKSDFGILTGALFWTYGIGQFVNGRLSEIVGPAKFVIASVVLSVAAGRELLLPHGGKARERAQDGLLSRAAPARRIHVH